MNTEMYSVSRIALQVPSMRIVLYFPVQIVGGLTSDIGADLESFESCMI